MGVWPTAVDPVQGARCQTVGYTTCVEPVLGVQPLVSWLDRLQPVWSESGRHFFCPNSPVLRLLIRQSGLSHWGEYRMIQSRFGRVCPAFQLY
jgi:hypothetical protein